MVGRGSVRHGKARKPVDGRKGGSTPPSLAYVVRRGMAWQGQAWRGMAQQGKVWVRKDNSRMVARSVRLAPRELRLGRARHGEAGPGRARHGPEWAF